MRCYDALESELGVHSAWCPQLIGASAPSVPPLFRRHLCSVRNSR